MKAQFEVWHFDFTGKGGPHPVVLLTRTDKVNRSKVVNVLYCTSQRQSRTPYPHEVMLNGADGLDWETFCDCSVMWSVESAKLFNKRGQVSLERRNAIRDKLRDIFRLSARD
jgi:hypothetical protein